MEGYLEPLAIAICSALEIYESGYFGGTYESFHFPATLAPQLRGPQTWK